MKSLGILIILSIFLVPGVLGTWQVTNIEALETGWEPSGATIEVHPLSKSWVIAYGQQNATHGEIIVRSSNDQFTSSSRSVIHESSADLQLTNVIGGMSTSLTGMTFCLQEEKSNETANNNDLYTFYNVDITDHATGPGHHLWSFNHISKDFTAAAGCDTSLPRYGWRAPPGNGIAWIKNPDGDTTEKSVFAKLNSNGQITRGPYDIGGEFSIGLDSMEFVMEPGWKYETPNYIGSPDKQPNFTETSCANAGWSFRGAVSALNCAAGKFGEVIMGAAERIRGVQTEDPTIGKAVVDLHTSATGAGLIVEPVTQHQVNFASHTFLRDADDQQDISILANRPGLSLRASDTTIMEPYISMIVWHDQDANEVRYRVVGHFDPSGSGNKAFDLDTRAQMLRIKSINPTPTGDGSTVVGVFTDGDTLNVSTFWTENRGRTWTNETINNDVFDALESSFTSTFHLADVAYDKSREQLIVAYVSDTHIKVANKSLSFEPQPIPRAQDTRGLLDDTGTTPEAHEFLGINVEPIGEESGLGIDGGKMFLAIILILGLMGGTFGLVRDGRLCVWMGGGLGLVLSFAFGLLGIWMIVVMAILFLGIGQAVNMTDQGIDSVRGRFSG